MVIRLRFPIIRHSPRHSGRHLRLKEFWNVQCLQIRVNSVVTFTDFSINKFARERPSAVRAALSIK